MIHEVLLKNCECNDKYKKADTQHHSLQIALFLFLIVFLFFWTMNREIALKIFFFSFLCSFSSSKVNIQSN